MNMKYSISELVKMVVGSALIRKAPDLDQIRFLSTDSRTLTSPEDTLFFALSGDLHEGHLFIPAAFELGVRNFVVKEDNTPDIRSYPANYIQTASVLRALQDIATAHRLKFSALKCVAITGSNGKTTVKEWLGSLLNRHEVVRSPKSYNSQTGVALSLWQIEKKHEIGIFEAGISQKGEMNHLEAMILPDIGIFTNIGDAHAAGFSDISEKIEEKLKLFRHASKLIYEQDDLLLAQKIEEKYPSVKKLTWGKRGTYVTVLNQQKQDHRLVLSLEKDKIPFELTLPFHDTASVQNFMHCLVLLLHLDYSVEEIQKNVSHIHNLPMRLEVKPGENNSIIINDTYNADLQSFDLALGFLKQQAQERDKWVVISAFDQTGKNKKDIALIISNLLSDAGVSTLFTIGEGYEELRGTLPESMVYYPYQSLSELQHYFSRVTLDNKAVLIKGSRRFAMEKIADQLAQKYHEAVLETDLLAVGHNLRYFSSWLDKDTGIIAVIKASAYGSGSHELAAYLEYARVNYLAVAYVDEGIALRKAGIVMPVMVLNSSSEQWAECAEWNLEPEIYSIEYMRKLWAVESTRHLRVHLKLDSGMNRLGLLPEDIEEAKDIVKQWTDKIVVGSIFTHLASSEDEKDDAFTHHQVAVFQHMYDAFTEVLSYKPKKHVLNTAGIRRFPEYQFDYVRLGLGLYGIDVTRTFSASLEKVHTFKAKIIQLKNVYQGHTVGYNRKWTIGKHGKVAIVNVGYADGLLRTAGNEKFEVLIKGERHPIVGNVNMDLTIVYIGERDDIEVGDEVEIFGKRVAVEDLANACQTIPYEIISRISPRVRRVYYRG